MRDRLVREMKKRGWCYDESNWHRCGKPSTAKPAKLPTEPVERTIALVIWHNTMDVCQSPRTSDDETQRGCYMQDIASIELEKLGWCFTPMRATKPTQAFWHHCSHKSDRLQGVNQ